MISITGSKVRFSKEEGMIEVFKENGPISVCIFVNEHVFYYTDGYLNTCTGTSVL